jgi:hypothetical protein
MAFWDRFKGIKVKSKTLSVDSNGRTRVDVAALAKEDRVKKVVKSLRGERSARELATR